MREGGREGRKAIRELVGSAHFVFRQCWRHVFVIQNSVIWTFFADYYRSELLLNRRGYSSLCLTFIFISKRTLTSGINSFRPRTNTISVALWRSIDGNYTQRSLQCTLLCSSHFSFEYLFRRRRKSFVFARQFCIYLEIIQSWKEASSPSDPVRFSPIYFREEDIALTLNRERVGIMRFFARIAAIL